MPNAGCLKHGDEIADQLDPWRIIVVFGRVDDELRPFPDGQRRISLSGKLSCELIDP